MLFISHIPTHLQTKFQCFIISCPFQWPTYPCNAANKRIAFPYLPFQWSSCLIDIHASLRGNNCIHVIPDCKRWRVTNHQGSCWLRSPRLPRKLSRRPRSRIWLSSPLVVTGTSTHKCFTLFSFCAFLLNIISRQFGPRMLAFARGRRRPMSVDPMSSTHHSVRMVVPTEDQGSHPTRGRGATQGVYVPPNMKKWRTEVKTKFVFALFSFKIKILSKTLYLIFPLHPKSIPLSSGPYSKKFYGKPWGYSKLLGSAICHTSLYCCPLPTTTKTYHVESMRNGNK